MYLHLRNSAEQFFEFRISLLHGYHLLFIIYIIYIIIEIIQTPNIRVFMRVSILEE